MFGQDDTMIRVNVRLVRILATVKDSSGGLIGSLTSTHTSTVLRPAG